MNSNFIAICTIAIALAAHARAASLMPNMGAMSALPQGMMESMNPASFLGSGTAEPEDAEDFAKRDLSSRGLLATALPLAAFGSSETKDIPLVHDLMKRDEDQSINVDLDLTDDLEKRGFLGSSPITNLLKSETGNAPITQGLLKRGMLSSVPGLSALPMGGEEGLPLLGSVLKRDMLSSIPGLSALPMGGEEGLPLLGSVLKRDMLSSIPGLSALPMGGEEGLPLLGSVLKRDMLSSIPGLSALPMGGEEGLPLVGSVLKRDMLSSIPGLSALPMGGEEGLPLLGSVLKRDMLSSVPGLSALPMGGEEGLPIIGSVLKRDLLSNVAPTELVDDSLGSLTGFKKVRRSSRD